MRKKVLLGASAPTKFWDFMQAKWSDFLFAETSTRTNFLRLTEFKSLTHSDGPSHRSSWISFMLLLSLNLGKECLRFFNEYLFSIFSYRLLFVFVVVGFLCTNKKNIIFTCFVYVSEKFLLSCWTSLMNKSQEEFCRRKVLYSQVVKFVVYHHRASIKSKTGAFVRLFTLKEFWHKCRQVDSWDSPRSTASGTWLPLLQGNKLSFNLSCVKI